MMHLYLYHQTTLLAHSRSALPVVPIVFYIAGQDSLILTMDFGLLMKDQKS